MSSNNVDEICRGACSIQCLPAMGKIPELKCKMCARMFHRECFPEAAKASGAFCCEVNFGFNFFLLI